MKITRKAPYSRVYAASLELYQAKVAYDKALEKLFAAEKHFKWAVDYTLDEEKKSYLNGELPERKLS